MFVPVKAEDQFQLFSHEDAAKTQNSLSDSTVQIIDSSVNALFESDGYLMSGSVAKVILQHYFKNTSLRGHKTTSVTCKELKQMKFQLTMTPMILTFKIIFYKRNYRELHARGFGVFLPSEFKPNDVNKSKSKWPLSIM